MEYITLMVVFVMAFSLTPFVKTNAEYKNNWRRVLELNNVD